MRVRSWLAGPIAAASVAASITDSLGDGLAPNVETARRRGPEIFNAVHNSMRQWGSSLHHNGSTLSLFALRTLLYSGICIVVMSTQLTKVQCPSTSLQCPKESCCTTATPAPTHRRSRTGLHTKLNMLRTLRTAAAEDRRVVATGRRLPTRVLMMERMRSRVP